MNHVFVINRFLLISLTNDCLRDDFESWEEADFA